MNLPHTKKLLNSYSDYLTRLGLSDVSIKNYKSDIKAFLEVIGYSENTQITESVIKSYRELISSNLKPQVYKRKITALHHLAKYLGIDQGKSNIGLGFNLSKNLSLIYLIIVFFLIVSLYMQAKNNSELITKLPEYDLSNVRTTTLGAQTENITSGVVIDLQNKEDSFEDVSLSSEILKNYPINKDENLPIFYLNTNNKKSINEIGDSILKAGSKSIDIKSQNVKLNTKVFITSRTVSDANLSVVKIYEGSFTVESNIAPQKDIHFYWMIIEQ